MRIIILLIFQILLVSTSVFAEMNKVEMLKMVCDEDNSNIRQIVAMCIDEMDIEPVNTILCFCLKFS
ncbi:hypothetical protein AVEN_48684-1 [Araneus ventricosus]|uniref:Uncharacterized protein n=1 Tax=Araneus ventricosus TaxID=182803 RepID=A0A4Y2FXB5_ARAVE|nr:hypothetical protein AVEN_48684-1 [Araneus ventricosus]